MLWFFPLVIFFMANCSLNKTDRLPAGHFSSVTVETSGDIYSEEGGANSQVDFFGNCLPGQSIIYIQIEGKMKAANCRKGHYTISVNLPKSFFKTSGKKGGRYPASAKQLTKKISVFHRGGKGSKVTSYLSIDPLKKEAVLTNK